MKSDLDTLRKEHIDTVLDLAQEAEAFVIKLEKMARSLDGLAKAFVDYKHVENAQYQKVMRKKMHDLKNVQHNIHIVCQYIDKVTNEYQFVSDTLIDQLHHRLLA